ncbi:hypothetical protein K8T06_01110 [bacterium]|nr:hypothetical protein [bacterium]
MSKIKKFLENQQSWTTTLTNVCVIVGIIFIYFQLNQSYEQSEIEIAIHVIDETRTPEFLRSVARLKTASLNAKGQSLFKKTIGQIYTKGDFSRNLNCMIDDVNIVLSVFINCWNLDQEGLANRNLFRRGIYPEVREFSKILDALEDLIPSNINRREFDKFLAELQSRDWSSEKKYRKKLSKN